MANWVPISGAALQFSKNASGAAAADYYLKFYAAGTTTAISMATTSSGGTTLDKCKVDSNGWAVNGSDDPFIPHIDRDYKLVLYTNATDADNDATGSAAWVIDNLSTESADKSYTSVASLRDSTGNDSFNVIEIKSYYEITYPSAAGPKGGHMRHRTGGTNTSPTAGSPVAVSTIGTGTQAGYVWDGDGVEWKLSDAILRDVYNFGDPDTDVGNSINEAIAAGYKYITLPSGKMPLLTTANIPANTFIIGQGRGTTESSFSPGTEIEINADVVGIQFGYTGNSGSFNGARGFALTRNGTHNQNGIQIGTASVSCNRTTLADICVIGMGGAGIVNTHSNLTTLRDVMSILNGSHGVWFDELTADNNACKFEGCLDVRGNSGHGLYIQGTGATTANHSRSHFGGLIVAQSNALDGVQIETKFNELTIYAENNSGSQINLTASSSQNFIKSVNGDIVDNGTGNHWWNKDIGSIENSSVNYGGFNQMVINGNGGQIGINNGAGAVAGGWVKDHPSTRTFEERYTDSGSSFTHRIKHDNNGGTATTFSIFDINVTAANNRALFNAGIGTNAMVTNTNTPSGATSRAMPIYDENGILRGYIPVYASQW